MTQRSVRRRNRILAGGVILIAFAAMWGQYSMWQRYGVFDWWSAQPRFAKVLGRDYERGRFHNPPTPHYCIIDTMFPFAYPIAADVVGGPDGRPCDFHGTPTGVYLRWKDGTWTQYQLLGAP